MLAWDCEYTWTGGDWNSQYTTLDINQIPSHKHNVLSGSGANGQFLGLAPEINPESGWSHYYIKYDGVAGGPSYTKINTQNVGGGQGHRHYVEPPYFKCSVWYRVG